MNLKALIKSLKKHIKSGEWYEYTGKVEFYISDDYSDIYEIFKKSKRAAFITKKLWENVLSKEL